MYEWNHDCNCPDAFMSHELLEEGDLWDGEYHWSETFSNSINHSDGWLNINPHNAFYGIMLDRHDGSGGFYYDPNVCDVPSPSGTAIAATAMLAWVIRRKRR